MCDYFLCKKVLNMINNIHSLFEFREIINVYYLIRMRKQYYKNPKRLRDICGNIYIEVISLSYYII